MGKEIIGITESMAGVYNAKYQVYLHQDFYILNENFIKDVIDLHGKNPQYGMIRVIESKYTNIEKRQKHMTH